ncbi:DUF1761 family protein [Seongchinamella sediminis]|uniref:DUF1761 family protein n=1 Tax=Seongchinamella sediminis TaxID=2283635 RepID=A0A3L7E0P2_9GAMM|nr:DUF1761 domain-containing protein [Seongchinamella sediminis]RLQ21811.1 DUF1761 family protein [Seongchinamella sediminis]
MEVEISINLSAAMVAAVASFVLGGLWYGPAFGKRWQALVGLSDEDIASSGHPAKVFAAAFVLTLIQALMLSALIPADPDMEVGLVYALVIGISFVATAFGVNYLFCRSPRALFAIDAGYNVLQFALMGAIIGAFG